MGKTLLISITAVLMLGVAWPTLVAIGQHVLLWAVLAAACVLFWMSATFRALVLGVVKVAFKLAWIGFVLLILFVPRDPEEIAVTDFVD